MTIAAEPSKLEQFKAGKPGVYEDIPADVYHALDACSASRLKDMRQSAAHCRYGIDNPKSTPSMLLGSVLHTIALEPDAFASRFVMAGQCEAKTGKGVRCSRMGTVMCDGGFLCSQHHDPLLGMDNITVLNGEQFNTANDMALSIMCHPAARVMLNAEGPCELSLLWTDAETGLLCKARVDKLAAKYQTLVDLKTTTDASRDAFEKAIFNFGYAIQAAQYLAGAEACGIEADTFAFIAVENTPPHCVAVYQLEPEAVAVGWRQRQALLALYAACHEADTWPGYSDEPQMIGLPAWASREEF